MLWISWIPHPSCNFSIWRPSTQDQGDQAFTVNEDPAVAIHTRHSSLLKKNTTSMVKVVDGKNMGFILHTSYIICFKQSKLIWFCFLHLESPMWAAHWSGQVQLSLGYGAGIEKNPMLLRTKADFHGNNPTIHDCDINFTSNNSMDIYGLITWMLGL